VLLIFIRQFYLGLIKLNIILLKILLPPPRGEQGTTGIYLANGRGFHYF